MKIIHVTYTAERYGIGTFLYNLLECQAENFCDLKVAAAFYTEGPCMEKYRKLNIPLYDLRLSSARNIQAFLRFRKIFQEYDIINLHGPYIWAFLAAVSLKKKIVYTFHGALGLRSFLKIPLTKLFVKHLFIKRCDYITFASRAAFEHFCQGYDVKPFQNNYDIFPYGLNLANIRPQSEKKQVREQLGLKNRFAVGTAVRMVPTKRPDLLIHAFAKLRAKSSSRLILIGNGIDEYETYLRQLIKKLEIEESVQFLGYRSDALSIINALDVFVLPTQKEPFGLALLEAMTMGVPSIVFEDGGGTVEIVGNSGFVVNSVDQLAQTIEALKRDTKTRELKRKQARNRAKQFDMIHTASRLQLIYQGEING